MTKTVETVKNIEAGPPPGSIVQMDDVVDKVDTITRDVSTFYSHVVAGTTAEYYNHVLDTIILDLTIIPIERTIYDLDISDTESVVSAGFKEIAVAVSNLFGKDVKVVETDMVHRMNIFPVDDVRTARLLKHQNRLN